MIVYSASKQQFVSDVQKNVIHRRILSEMKRRLSHGAGESEISSWRNSLQYMSNLLSDDDIPVDAGVSIEYSIPLTSKRIDFILSGQDENRRDTAVIIELKQWSSADSTTKDGIVSTFLGGSKRETAHPSYQAWSYAALIEDYNETVRHDNIHLAPCAYLHNMESRDTINDPFYAEHTQKAPAFIATDVLKLQAFIKQFVRHGDSNNVMYRIEHGKIKPSRNLADSLLSMLQGNQEFLMIDEQKLVYETALDLLYLSEKQKQVLIVEGGPGTGKSVVAINLLVEMTNREKVAQYVSKNAAPRSVYEAKLKGTISKTRISNLFRGSGAFVNTDNDTFDALIIDEAHRLNEKSGLFSNLGENQIKEIIAAARLSIFFIDEAQRVTMKDIGRKEEIERWASQAGARVQTMELASQFRCNGSDGYLAFVDHALQIRETANQSAEGTDYEVRVFDSPAALRDAIYEKNLKANKARTVAGYCWDWTSKKDPQAMDIIFPEFNFAAQWNLSTDGNLWIMAPNSVNEIGCIHTCQGLELDYIGVIIGPDLIVRDGKIITDASKRSRMDSSVKGYKTLLKKDPEQARVLGDEIIKNTYLTLMTRGQKACYLYCTDAETNDYFKNLLAQATKAPEAPEELYPGLTLKVVQAEEIEKHDNAVPIYDLRIAAGDFSDYQQANEADWVELPEDYRALPGHFVARVVGESMNRRIPNGAWCLFRSERGGTRQNRIVLVQHRDIQDIDNGGHYTVKRYHSEKKSNADGTWQHESIILKPETNMPGYQEIKLSEDEAADLKVLGEFVAVIG